MKKWQIIENVLKFGGKGSGHRGHQGGTGGPGNPGGSRAGGGGAIGMAQDEIAGAQKTISTLKAKGKLTKSERSALNTYEDGVKSLEKRIERYKQVGPKGLTGEDLAQDGFISDGRISEVSSLLKAMRVEDADVAKIVDKLLDEGYVSSGQGKDLAKYLS